MTIELIELGYPVEDFSDQKVIRLYPKAIVPFDEMYNELTRRGFPMDDMCDERSKRN